MNIGNYAITPNGSFVSEDELYHYGVKGMKWSIVRDRKNPLIEKSHEENCRTLK